MIIDWGYTTIIAVFVFATIAYVLRGGSDPLFVALVVSWLILVGKAWAWIFGA